MSYIISEVREPAPDRPGIHGDARDTPVRKEPVDLRRSFVKETVKPYSQRPDRAHPVQVRHQGAGFPVERRRSQLQDAFRNLLTNAVEAIQPGRGEIALPI